jgi:hypothetical protein
VDSLQLNVGTSPSYMLGGIIVDRVDSFTDLRVVMDSRMSFSRHILMLRSERLCQCLNL